MTDALDRFSAALAAEHDGQVAVPSVTRTRIAQKLTRRRRRRSGWRVLLAIPLFALAGGTALAATGQLPLGPFASLAAWLEPDTKGTAGTPATSGPPGVHARKQQTPAAGSQEQPAPATPSSPASTEEKTNVRSLADLAETEVPTQSHAPASRPIDSRTIGSRSAGSRSAASRSAASRSVGSRSVGSRSVAPQGTGSRATPAQVAASRAPRGEPGLGTYAAAQQAQFRSADCATAIRLYEDYLGEAPAGAFVAEARFNRSLCLIRLGRITEARPALSSFAHGEFGDYRKLEAKRLLRALEKR